MLVLAAILSLRSGLPNPQRAQFPPVDHQKAIAQFLKDNPEGGERYLSIKQLDELGARELHAKGIYPKLVRGNPHLKTIALTIDDGPYPDSTPKLLAILRKYRVRATMFNIGYKILANPQLVKAEVADGHEIANHTLNHVSLPKLPSQDLIDDELSLGADAIRRVLPGYKAIDICRPRGGGYDERVIKSLKSHSYTMALWTDDPGDYLGISVAVLKKRLIDNLSPGAIVLVHDHVPNTLAVLPAFIKEARRRGYKFVSCEEMLKQKGCIVVGGPNTYAGQ